MAKNRVCHEVGLDLERLFARAFVIGGGLFWMMAAFFGDYGRTISPLVSARNALIPLTLTVIVFVLGLYNERLTAALLVATWVGLVAWGVVSGWETGIWVLFGVTLFGPILTAGVLYFLASDMQRVCDVAAARRMSENPAA